MNSESNPSAQRPPRRRGILLAGVVTGLIALAVLAVGGGIVKLDASHRNDDGFYTTEVRPVTTPTYALVSDRLDVGTDGPNWLFRKGRLGTISVTATGTDARPVFIGLAATSEVGSYLKRVEHEDITDFEIDPFTLNSARRSGSRRPAAPSGQHFWAESVSGSGKRTLTWPVHEGDWDVVVMNADGSRGIRTSLGVAAKVPAVRWLGRVLLIAGVMLALAAAVAIAAGARRPRGRSRTTATTVTVDRAQVDAVK